MTVPESLSISVLVPTFRRVDCLERCLQAIDSQTLPPVEIIVTVRDTDTESASFLDSYVPATTRLHRVVVTEPGVVAAMNAGLRACAGTVIALTDDDAAPWPTWLATLTQHFSTSEKVAGVGGRDYVVVNGQRDLRQQPVVGKIQWFGRIIGNHRWGVGSPREVAVLKGVNCAYRVEPLRKIGFDTRLRGTGAQIHWELSAGLSLIADGYTLVYDPLACVDHFEAARHDADQRVSVNFNSEAQSNAAFNETLVLLDHLSPIRRAAYLTWSHAIGTANSPGFMQLIRLLLRRSEFAFERYTATGQGRRAAVHAYAREQRSAINEGVLGL